MADVIWTDQALDQLDLIVTYVRLFDSTAAERLRVRFMNAAASLSEFPNRGRPVGDGLRREMVTVPPYVMRYRVADEHVYILGVRHGARLPD